MIVAKFGGSSMADAEQFKKVKRIIESNPHRSAVVVSALGKSELEPVKLTDQLIKLSQLKSNKLQYQNELVKIEKRLADIKAALALNVDIVELLKPIQSPQNNLTEAEITSRGEYFTATLLADYLDWQMVDAADFISINNHQIDYDLSLKKLNQITNEKQHLIVPGFYARNEQQQITLLERGGGDTSGAILANLLDADLYENWTDTSGILQVDPRIINHSRKIYELTFDELQELAYLGIQVFNSAAIHPVKIKGIPIQIKNTNHPQDLGTRVVLQRAHPTDITGFAGKQNQTIINLKQYQLNRDISAIAALINCLRSQNYNFEYYQTAADQLTLIFNQIEDQELCNALDLIQQQFSNQLEINVQNHIALVAIVSESLKQHPAMTGSFIDKLDQSDINVKSVFQATNDIKVVFGVNNCDYQNAIKMLYNQA
ncbi:aspartate kinase [Fructilactobacillus vespulae]|uniref:aspartate kinase n=1 Tax=Fructilactobacillus vespulae TaxID=1249630 RepID=UPI0039B4F6B6